MLLALPGQRLRCVSCGHRFEANTPTEPPPVERLPPLEAVPTDNAAPSRPDPPRRRRDAEPSQWPDADRYPPNRFDVPLRLRPLLPEEEDGLPFCPGCGRRVRWEVVLCTHCDEEFEDDRELRRQRSRSERPRRRDMAPHRGPLIANLGNLSLTLGILALCAGVTALVGLPLGIVAWVMANGDLDAIRNGLLDSRGRQQTELGRNNAITAVLLCSIFAGVWMLLWFWMR